MPQDFSGQTLRGRSFKGQDLTGANFSHADIRGANFTNATLIGANFSHAKTGLPRSWATFLVIVSLALSAISGFASALVGVLVSGLFTVSYIKEYNTNHGVVILVVLVVLFIITIRQGLVAGAAAATVAATTVAAATGDGNVTVTVAGAAAATVGGAVTVAGAAAAAGAMAMAIAAAVTVTMAIAAAVAVTVTMAGAVTMAMAMAIAVAVLSVYIAWRALAEDEKYAFVRTSAIDFANTGGTTSFRKADLTDADFTQATLRSTNFRRAILTRTRWYKAKKLDLARVDNSILAKASVRDLLVSGNGYKKSYIGENLKGANLTGSNLSEANLKEADISEATLQRANLEGANLTKTQAIGTNFTDAYLTGACLEAWNIDSTTQLEHVDCRYIYLLEHPQAKTDDRERRPSSGHFAPGEFTKLFQEVLNTIDLIFRNGIDWKAFIASFKKLEIDNEGIPLEIQRIEDKGDGVVVVRVSVPPETNKAKIHSEFMQNYELALKAVEEKYKAELNGKDEQLAIYRQQSADMWLAINKLAEKPVTVEVKATAESKAMSDSSDQSRNIKIGDIQGGDVTGLFLGDNANISGTVANTISQLSSSPQPDKPGIKELLTQLQEAIEADTNLTEEDKAEALEQVKALAEAGKNPQEGAMQKASKTAIKILKGTVAGLPSAATLVEACNKLLPAIASFLGLA